MDGGAHRGPGIGATERGVAAPGKGYSGSGKARQPIEIALVTRFDISLVGIAAFGHELRLHADREAKRGNPRPRTLDKVVPAHAGAPALIGPQRRIARDVPHTPGFRGNRIGQHR